MNFSLFEDIKCTLELDKGKTNKRLYFRDATTNKKIYERRELVTMPEKDRDICKNFSRIFVEVCTI